MAKLDLPETKSLEWRHIKQGSSYMSATNDSENGDQIKSFQIDMSRIL